MSTASENPGSSHDEEKACRIMDKSEVEASVERPQSGDRYQFEYDGVNDGADPWNWPLWKRLYHTAIPALQGFIITLAASSYVPAIPYLVAHFRISQEAATLGVSLYLFGLALGPLPVAPLSELIGRPYIYMIALPLLIFFNIGAACSRNITTLLVLRFFSALLGSGALAVIAGTVMDVWDINKGGSTAAVLCTMTPFLGPVLGPIVGVYMIDEYGFNWRFALWAITFAAVPIMIMSLFLSETCKPIILTKRAKSRNYSLPPRPSTFAYFHKIIRISFTRPIYMLLFDPLVTFYTFYMSFTLLVLFSFFGSYSSIFIGVFGLSDKDTSLAFIAVLIGLLLGVVLFGALDKIFYQKPGGLGIFPAPEVRLYPLLVSSVLLPISLFWLAWSSTSKVHWAVPMAAGLPFGCATSCIYFTTLVYLVQVYKSEAGASVLAALGLLRYTLAGVSPLFVTQMYTALGPRWAGSVLAFISLGLMPVPWVFWKYGAMLRAKKALIES